MSCNSCRGMGVQDLVTKFADFIVRPAHSCPFMSSRILHHSMKQIVINHFHIHGDYIAGDGIDIHDNPFSTFCQGKRLPNIDSNMCVEEVTPIESHTPCPFLVPEKLTELGLYSLEQFESMFREAAESDAKTLALFLKKYRQMGVLDFKGKDKKQIFAELRACFPTMKRYSYSNFIYYF